MTNRTTYTLQLVLAAAFLLYSHTLSAQASAAAAPSQPASEWQTFTSSDDGFSVSFPGAPDASKQSVPTDAGTFELHTYLVTSGTAEVYVGICDYGSIVQGHDPQAVLAGAEKGAIDNVKAHIVSDQKISLGKYPGVEFEADNDRMHFTARLYLVDTMLYEVLTAAPIDNRYADAKRFMDSFQLTSRGTN